METECAWRSEFLAEAYRRGALTFGKFVLKSGRPSPYFFNIGRFDDGESFQRLCDAYAAAIDAALLSGEIPEFDVLFGLAYKGIPLAAGVAATLWRVYGRNLLFAFNRQEMKTHGDGGMIVGATAVEAMQTRPTRVLLIDDVITAGTAVGEAMDLLTVFPNVKVVGAAVVLDRQEVLEEGSAESAMDGVERKFGFKVLSVAKFIDLIHYAEAETNTRENKGEWASRLADMEKYMKMFGSEVAKASILSDTEI